MGAAQLFGGLLPHPRAQLCRTDEVGEEHDERRPFRATPERHCLLPGRDEAHALGAELSLAGRRGAGENDLIPPVRRDVGGKLHPRRAFDDLD